MAKSPRPTRITLSTVAEQAEVSVATASLILSGREEWLRQFRPETIERTRKAAARLGYRANVFATGISSRGSLLFALVVHDVDTHMLVTWHHWAFEGALIAGVIESAADSGLFPVLATADYEAPQDRLRSVERLIDGGVFGAIVRTPGARLTKFLRGCLKRAQPIAVVFPRRLSAWPTNAIDVDNLAIGRQAGRILAARGRKRWAIVRYTAQREAWRQREQGCLEVANEVGARTHTIRVPMGLDEHGAADRIARRLGRSRPDAVFALDSIASVGSLLGTTQAGLRPPDDIELVGCDCSVWRDQALPTLTSVDVSWKEIGQLALRTLVDLADRQESRFPTILARPRVVPGDTCPVELELMPTPT